MSQWFAKELGHTGQGYLVSLEAQIATEIARHNSMVAGIEDGEDSKGRAKLRLQTPAECVSRAVEIAAGLVAQFESRGWVRQIALTPEEDWQTAGHLQGVKHDAQFGDREARSAQVRKILETVKSDVE